MLESVLSTILSRLMIEDHRQRVQIQAFDLDIKKLDLKQIYNFLKEPKTLTQEEVKQKIQSLLFYINQAGIKLSDTELSGFDRALLANVNYQKFEYVFLPLLLKLLEKRRR